MKWALIGWSGGGGYHIGASGARFQPVVPTALTESVLCGESLLSH